MSPARHEIAHPSAAGKHARGAARNRQAGRAASGFVLLETLVALALAALLLTILSRSLLGSWSGTAHAREDLQAMMLARSVLDGAWPRTALAPGVRTGDSGGYVWRAETALASTRASEVAPGLAKDRQVDSAPAVGRQWPLYRIIVTVTAPSGRRVLLEAFRLGA